MDRQAEPSFVAPLKDEGRFLIVQMHSSLCAILLSQVVEIMRPQPLETVAGMQPFVLGVALIRGQPVPVIGLDAVLTGCIEERANRYVSIRVGSRTISLAVKGIVGVEMIECKALEELPGLLQNANTNAIQMIGSTDQQLLIMLQSSRLLSEEAWQSLFAGKANPQ